ncbi:MAG: glycosyltransferase family 9 protein [Rhodospirillaceae bacterium]|nr:glycosyltransferase family 9 protein [Rhodospirillaceae bacterium]MBL6942093.1 glycosyltransferase family 9 protein [Rhodospirillales bacterium]
MFPEGMRRRWWLFRLFDLIARYMPVLKPRRGVLVVRMDGIGDMVLFRTSLEHYAEVFGVEKSDITVLGCESWSDITSEVFAGYRVLIINEHAFARWPLYRFWVSLKVRALNPAISVCDSYLRRTMMADSLVWVSGASQAISSLPFIGERTRPEYLYYLSQVDKVVPTGDYPTHEIVRHYNFLSAIAGRKIKPEAPHISWRDTLPSKDLIPPGVPYAVLNPGSNEYGRRWPLAKYQQLAAALIEKNLHVIFVGGGGERPGVIDTGESRIIDLIGRTDLPQLLDIMNHAQLVVSNDTGPAHLSIALGTPTLVVVGGGHFGCFVPYPEEVRPTHARFVYYKMDCYHCFWNCPKRASKFEVFPCVEAVSIEQVCDEVETLLVPGP